MFQAVVQLWPPVDGDGSAPCARNGFHKFHLACFTYKAGLLTTDFSKGNRVPGKKLSVHREAVRE